MTRFYTLISLFFIGINIQAQTFSENFDSAVAVIDPDLGWTQGSSWFFDTAESFMISGTRSAICYESSDDWLISPGFTLQAGNQVDINFKYRTNSNASKETADITVYIGRVASSDIATDGTVILDDEAIHAPNIAGLITDFVADESGMYYLAFHAVTDPNESFSVDDIVIGDQVLSINRFNKNDFSVYPNPSSNEITVTGGILEQMDVFSFTGQKVLTSQTQTTRIESLDSGIYLAKIKFIDGSSRLTQIIVE